MDSPEERKPLQARREVTEQLAECFPITAVSNRYDELAELFVGQL